MWCPHKQGRKHSATSSPNKPLHKKNLRPGLSKPTKHCRTTTADTACTHQCNYPRRRSCLRTARHSRSHTTAARVDDLGEWRASERNEQGGESGSWVLDGQSVLRDTLRHARTCPRAIEGVREKVSQDDFGGTLWSAKGVVNVAEDSKAGTHKHRNTHFSKGQRT